METLEAIAAAKKYLQEVFADEKITDISLEEIENLGDRWRLVLAFSRPWNTPRTRAQEVLEQIGAASPARRSYKTLVLLDDGSVQSMKDRQTADVSQ